MRCGTRTERSRRRSVAAAMVLIMVLSAIPFVAPGAASAQMEPTHTVTYLPGTPEGLDAAFNDGKAEQLVVDYYGTPFAEYNPQFWHSGGSEDYIVGDPNRNDPSDWYPITKYTAGKTVVFNGWLVGDTKETVDPGEVLTGYCDAQGRVTLTATWAVLNDVKWVGPSKTGGWNGNCSSIETGGQYRTAMNNIDPKGTGTMYTNLILVNNSSLSLSGAPVLEKPVTIRPVPGVDCTINMTNGDNFTMNADLIVDGMATTGPYAADDFNALSWCVYAQGNTILFGPGNRDSGGRYPAVFGGWNDKMDHSTDTTDVRIFGGAFATVFGGNTERELGTSNVVVLGGKVTAGVYGGNNYGFSRTTDTVKTANVWVSGDARFDRNVIGGSKAAGYVGTTNVVIDGDAQGRTAQAGGRNGTFTLVEDANITVGGRATVWYMVVGSVSDGNQDSRSVPVVQSHVTIRQSAVVGDSDSVKTPDERERLDWIGVYGGGRDTWSSVIGPSTDATHVVIEGGTINGSVYGGGLRGSVGTASVTITGGTVTGNVYGGGRGAADTNPNNSDSTGKAYVTGTYLTSDLVMQKDPEKKDCSVLVDIKNATIQGSVYGGGCGVVKTKTGGHEDVSSVTGNIYVQLRNATIGTAGKETGVFGGGKGFSNNDKGTYNSSTERIAAVYGDVKVVLLSGTVVNGSVYGGGEFGQVRFKGAALDHTVIVTVLDSTVNGNIHGGGLGESDRLSVSVEERNVVLKDSTVSGSVYGGSRNGLDNCLRSDGKLVPDGRGEAYVYIISSDIFNGTSGSVYGGGYRGHAYMNTHVYVGAPAVEEMKKKDSTVGWDPTGTLLVDSVFGGSSVGTDGSDGGVLLHGDTEVIIGHTASGNKRTPTGEYTDSRIHGNVFGSGDLCDISGTSRVEFDRFSQNDPFLSIQRADELLIKDSTVSLLGSLDPSRSELMQMNSLNDIGMLTMESDGTAGSRIEMWSNASQICGFKSTYTKGVVPSEETKWNTFKVRTGGFLSFLGTEDRGQNVSEISGSTVLESDDNDYYGAFAMGKYESVNTDFTFHVLTATGWEQAKSAELAYQSMRVMVWFISGNFTAETSISLLDTAEAGGTVRADRTVIIPRLATGTGVSYLGMDLELAFQGSLNLVGSLDAVKSAGNDVVFTLGTGKGAGETIFEGGLNPATSGKVAATQSGLNLTFSIVTNSKFSNTGYIGTATFYMAETSGNTMISMFDVKVSIFLRSPQIDDITTFTEKIILKDGVGSADMYLPYLDSGNPGDYTITSISGMPAGSSVVLTAKKTALNRDGWLNTDMRTGKQYQHDGIPQSGIYMGTAARFTPVIGFEYHGAVPTGDIEVRIELTEQTATGTKTHSYTFKITVEEQPKVGFTLVDKYLDGSAWTSQDLFTVELGFGETVLTTYVGVNKTTLVTVAGTHEAYAKNVADSLYKIGGKIVTSSTQSIENLPAEYTVMTLGQLMQVDSGLFDGKPKYDSHSYKEMHPSWYYNEEATSPFDSGAPVTSEKRIFVGYYALVEFIPFVSGIEGNPDFIPRERFMGMPGDTVTLDIADLTVTTAGWKAVSFHTSNSAVDPISQYKIQGVKNTVYVLMQKIEYTLTVNTAGSTGNVTVRINNAEAQKPYRFTVDDQIVLTVTAPLRFNSIAVKLGGNEASTGDLIGFTSSSYEISFKARAFDTELTLELKEFYKVTVSMPLDYLDTSDNQYFHFKEDNGTWKIADGGSDATGTGLRTLEYHVSTSSGAITFQGLTTKAGYNVTLTLYKVTGKDYTMVGSAYTNEVTIDTSGIDADADYVIHMGIERPIALISGEVTVTVTPMAHPLGGNTGTPQTYDSDNYTAVKNLHKGDLVEIKAKEYYDIVGDPKTDGLFKAESPLKARVQWIVSIEATTVPQNVEVTVVAYLHKDGLKERPGRAGLLVDGAIWRNYSQPSVTPTMKDDGLMLSMKIALPYGNHTLGVIFDEFSVVEGSTVKIEPSGTFSFDLFVIPTGELVKPVTAGLVVEEGHISGSYTIKAGDTVSSNPVLRIGEKTINCTYKDGVLTIPKEADQLGFTVSGVVHLEVHTVLYVDLVILAQTAGS